MVKDTHFFGFPLLLDSPLCLFYSLFDGPQSWVVGQGDYKIYCLNQDTFAIKQVGMDNYTRTTGVNQDCYGQTGLYGLPSHQPFPIYIFFPFVILHIAILSTVVYILMITKFASNFCLEFLIRISSPMPDMSSTGPIVMSNSSWIQLSFITESSLLVFS